jgi:hypothetical protein
MKILTIILVMACLCLGIAVAGDAAMSSANYRIETTVMSSGGGSMASANYQLTGTLGQPSPLVDDPLFPPSSTSYAMLTGFWYTIGGGGCTWDFEPDGDVDGADLYEFINAFNLADVPSFAAEFGSAGCE